jgi:competence protein ComEA
VSTEGLGARFIGRYVNSSTIFRPLLGKEYLMKRLLVLLVALFALCGMAYAAVDLNTADQKTLETVNGIGPAHAKAIIEYRTKNGPFKSAEDLDHVKGIGKKTMAKIAPQVTIGGKALASGSTDAKKPDDKKPSVAAPTSAPAPAVAAQAKKPDTKDVMPEAKDSKADDKSKK